MPGASPWGEAVQPRVFIEHSSYDLLNIGDTAMLKTTVTRLQDRWPRARLQIITTSRERLTALCPGTTESEFFEVARAGAFRTRAGSIS